MLGREGGLAHFLRAADQVLITYSERFAGCFPRVVSLSWRHLDRERFYTHSDVTRSCEYALLLCCRGIVNGRNLDFYLEHRRFSVGRWPVSFLHKVLVAH